MSPERILSKLGINNIIKVSVDDTVEQVLRLLDEKQVRAVPVVDHDGCFKGMFSTHEVIKSLVPSYAVMGMQTLDFASGASGQLAHKLRNLYPSRVGDHVSANDVVKITDKTGTWEALRMLAKHGSPIPAVNATGHLIGLISEQSAIEALLRMEADEAETENSNEE
jgi:CBS-domain-containing membrane protein